MTIHLHMLRPKRLIRARLRWPGLVIERRERHLALSGPHVRTPHPLIRIRRLLCPRLTTSASAVGVSVIGTPAAAAANGQQPEEAGGGGECAGEPGNCEGGAGDGGGDAVLVFQVVVKCGSEDEEDGGREDCSAEVGDGGGAGKEGGEERAPAGEDGREANQDGEAGCGEGGGVEHEHGGVVGVEASRERVGEVVVGGDAGAVQAPDLDGVEPEVGFGIGAVGVFVVAIPAAVVAEIDGVVVFQSKRLFRGLKGPSEDGRVVRVVTAEEVGRGSGGEVF
jgi:hypothetical protein